MQTHVCVHRSTPQHTQSWHFLLFINFSFSFNAVERSRTLYLVVCFVVCIGVLLFFWGGGVGTGTCIG